MSWIGRLYLQSCSSMVPFVFKSWFTFTCLYFVSNMLNQHDPTAVNIVQKNTLVLGCHNGLIIEDHDWPMLLWYSIIDLTTEQIKQMCKHFFVSKWFKASIICFCIWLNQEQETCIYVVYYHISCMNIYCQIPFIKSLAHVILMLYWTTHPRHNYTTPWLYCYFKVLNCNIMWFNSSCDLKSYNLRLALRHISNAVWVVNSVQYHILNATFWLDIFILWDFI